MGRTVCGHIDDMAMMLEAENFDAGEMQAVWQRIKGTMPQDQQWSMGLCIPRFKPPVSWMIAERQPNGSLEIRAVHAQAVQAVGIWTRLLHGLLDTAEHWLKRLSTHFSEPWSALIFRHIPSSVSGLQTLA